MGREIGRSPACEATCPSQGVAFLESSLACAERMIHVTLGDVPWNQEADVEGVLKTATARDERAFPTQSAPGTDPKTDPRPVQAPPAKYVPTTTHGALLAVSSLVQESMGLQGVGANSTGKFAITDWPGVSMRLRTCHTKQPKQGCGKCARCNGTDMRESTRARASRATGG